MTCSASSWPSAVSVNGVSVNLKLRHGLRRRQRDMGSQRTYRAALRPAGQWRCLHVIFSSVSHPLQSATCVLLPKNHTSLRARRFLWAEVANIGAVTGLPSGLRPSGHASRPRMVCCNQPMILFNGHFSSEASPKRSRPIPPTPSGTGWSTGLARARAARASSGPRTTLSSAAHGAALSHACQPGCDMDVATVVNLNIF